MNYIISIVASVLAATYVLLVALLRLTQDAKEPVSISDSIPFVTPMVNMASKGGKFYELMRDKYRLPIYTLRIPGLRIYVVNHASLITSVQTQVRDLSFPAIVATFTSNLAGVNSKTYAIMRHDITNDKSYAASFPRYLHSSLRVGPGLDAMNRRSIQVIAESLDRWAERRISIVNMFQWVRHELLMASTEAVYGPKNPFRDPEMESAWYTFEANMPIFAFDLFPRLLAPKSFKAREYMVKVWERYFDEGSHKTGSEMTKSRIKIHEDFGFSLKETARIEIGGCLAVLVNTLPVTFWVIYHIFSNPNVLEDIRSEVSKGVQTDENGAHTIDLTHVKSSCPILLSTVKETMRLYASSPSMRIAVDDHYLDKKYLLKKGSAILMPSSVQHHDRGIWGDTVDKFDHKRFVHEPGTKRINPTAFRSFGGGTTLCPGRHFASTEILMFSASMVLRFDVHPVGSKWAKLPAAKSSTAPPGPESDLEVELRTRDGGKDWNVSFSGYQKGMEIAAEDIEGFTPSLHHTT